MKIINYWEKICEIEKRQTEKGIKTYGKTLEENQEPAVFTRIEYFQEELVDALKYSEWIKEGIRREYHQGRIDERLRIINLIKEIMNDDADTAGCRACYENILEIISFGSEETNDN